MNTDTIAVESSVMLGSVAGILTNALNTGDPVEIERMVRAVIEGIDEYAETIPNMNLDISISAQAQSKAMNFARKVKYGE